MSYLRSPQATALSSNNSSISVARGSARVSPRASPLAWAGAASREQEEAEVVDDGNAAQLLQDVGGPFSTETSAEYGACAAVKQSPHHFDPLEPAAPGDVEEEVIASTVPEPVPSKTLSDRFRTGWLEAKQSAIFFRQRVREMTWKQILWVVLLVVLVMAGNAMQILMLNFWLDSFPEGGAPGNYTAFAVPGILFSIFFVLVLAVYVVFKRPKMKFTRSWYGWAILVGVGFCDTFNSWLATYAASYTSEVLQALFTNLCPLYAVFMSKWILHDPRKYFNEWIIAVFVLTIVGILAASLYGLIESRHMGSGNVWILIFFLSIPFRVLMNVWQSLYMIVYTLDPSFTAWLGRRLWIESPQHQTGHSGAADETGGDGDACESGVGSVRGAALAPAPLEYNVQLLDDIALDDHLVDRGNTAHMLVAPSPSPALTDIGRGIDRTPDHMVHLDPPTTLGNNNSITNTVGAGSNAPPPSTSPQPPVTQECIYIRYHQGEDMIVKLVMLAGDTVFQTCFTLSLLPADALPWWGNSATVDQTWSNFVEGIVCVFTIRNNFIFGFLYTLGFVFTYVGCAYLNHYSVALCSIVSQLSSPLTALLLVIVPSWNVQEGGDSPWYCNLIAIVLLSIAALVYVVWEEMTDDEKVEGERVLKMRKLGVRPYEYEGRKRDTPKSRS